MYLEVKGIMYQILLEQFWYLAAKLTVFFCLHTQSPVISVHLSDCLSVCLSACPSCIDVTVILPTIHTLICNFDEYTIEQRKEDITTKVYAQPELFVLDYIFYLEMYFPKIE